MDIHLAELLQSFEALTFQKQTVFKLLCDTDLEKVWIPDDYILKGHNELVRTCSEIATRLFYYEERNHKDAIPVGLFIVDEATVVEIEKLNGLKLSFKAAVAKFKKKEKFRSLGVLLDRAYSDNPVRDPAIKTALKTMNLTRLDLKCAYRKIRILDENIKSLRWSKEGRHLATTPLNRAELTEMIEQLPEDSKQASMLTLMENNDKHFAQVKEATKRYMCNLTWHDRIKGQLDTVPVSGFMVSACTKLPEIYWPADIYTRTQGKRTGKHVDLKSPISTSLNVYRYITITKEDKNGK